MNTLQKKYSKRGLSVVGVTDGDVKNTETWVKQFEAQYPFAYDASFFCLRSSAFSYPWAMLIDPAGIVVWTGHPSKIDDKLIEKHLPGAFEQPLPEWPEPLAKVGALLREGALGQAVVAVEALAKADASMAKWATAVKGFATAKIGVVKRLMDAGDWYRAWPLAHDLAPRVEGADPEGKVAAWIASMSTDEVVRVAYEVQDRVQTLAGRAIVSKGETQEVIAALGKLVADQPESIATKDARNAINYLNRLITSGYFKDE